MVGSLVRAFFIGLVVFQNMWKVIENSTKTSETQFKFLGIVNFKWTLIAFLDNIIILKTWFFVDCLVSNFLDLIKCSKGAIDIWLYILCDYTYICGYVQISHFHDFYNWNIFGAIIWTLQF